MFTSVKTGVSPTYELDEKCPISTFRHTVVKIGGRISPSPRISLALSGMIVDPSAKVARVLLQGTVVIVIRLHFASYRGILSDIQLECCLSQSASRSQTTWFI